MQTSIEWLEEKLIDNGVNFLSEEFEFIKQAKLLHKQEIINNNVQIDSIIARLTQIESKLNQLVMNQLDKPQTAYEKYQTLKREALIMEAIQQYK